MFTTRRLKTGLVGLAQDGQFILNALRGIGCIELVAVAGSQCEKFAADLGVTGYHDPRSLAVEHDLDLVLVAAPVHTTQETLLAAARRGLPVWRWPPVGRTVEEAAEIVHAFEQAGTPLGVGEKWPLHGARVLADAHRDAIGTPALIIVQDLRNDPRHDTWLGDLSRSGGGDALRLVAAVAGLPASVHCQTSRTGTPGLPFTYDTEDTAVVTLAYESGAVASLVFSRTHDDDDAGILVRSGGATMRRDADAIVVQLEAGPVHGVPLKTRPVAVEGQIETFAHAIITEEHAPPDSDALLVAHAIVDAAYLSARTGDAESPQRFFELARSMSNPI
jgi:predicted dehydrogenase